mmetsp:Transcript_27363/g.49703  ORF Transcript_27363/g.49703 Transcript_27363/m.49703 type:complete len:312 (+) Transcript_27363:60-995(+)
MLFTSPLLKRMWECACQQSEMWDSFVSIMRFYSFFVVSLYLSKGGLLLGLFNGHSLGTLVEFGLGLKSHDSTSPLANNVGVVVKLFTGNILKELELSLVLLGDIREAHDRSGTLVYESTKTRLILDNHERNVHLTAEGGDPHDKFHGVNIAGNEHKSSLLVFNESGHVLESELDLVGHAGRGGSSTGSGGSSLLDALFLGSSSFGTVLIEKRKHSHGLVLVNGLGKLVNGGGHLQTLVQDRTLTLDAHVLGPLDKTTQITSLGANGTSNHGGTRASGKKRVTLGLGLLGGSSRGRLSTLLNYLLCWRHCCC